MRGQRDMTEDEKRSLIYGGTPGQKSIPVQGGAASRVPTYSDRTDLNDMLNSSPETQFLGTQPTPTPTPTPAPTGINASGRTNPFQFFALSESSNQATSAYQDMVHSYFQRPPSLDTRYNPDPESKQFSPNLVPQNRTPGATPYFDPSYSTGTVLTQNQPMSSMEMADLQKKYGFNYG